MVKVGGGRVLYTKVIYYEGEGGGAGGVAEKHGSGGFVIAVGVEEGEEAALGQEAGLGKAGDCFDNAKETVRVASGVGVEVGVMSRSSRTERGMWSSWMRIDSGEGRVAPK